MQSSKSSASLLCGLMTIGTALALPTIATDETSLSSYANCPNIPSYIAQSENQFEGFWETGNGVIFDIEETRMANESSFSSFATYLEKQLSTFCEIEDFAFIADYCRERPKLSFALVDFLRNAIAYIDPEGEHDSRISMFYDPEIEESFIYFRILCHDFDPRFEDNIFDFYKQQSALLANLDGWIQISSYFI